MTAVRTLAIGMVALATLASTSRGAALGADWRWTTWTPSTGVTFWSGLAVPAGWNTPSISPIQFNTQATAPLSAQAAVTPSIASNSPPTQSVADAYLNMANGPYPEAAQLTSGGAQPWYLSPSVEKVFGGVPNDQQRLDFSNAVLNRVEQTFQLGGVPLALTNNPNDPVSHTVSVVSGTSYPANPNAVGIADVGNNGFTFVDKLPYATTVDELEWAVAHNVAHELMHAFGVGHHDTTGNYLDSAVTPWSTLVNPSATFSPAAVQDLLSKNFRASPNTLYGLGAEMIDRDVSTLGTQAVPEPATILVWGMASLALGFLRYRRMPESRIA